MNNIQVFAFNDAVVRTMSKEGETLFRASDIASALELGSASQMIRHLDEEDARGVFKDHTPTPSGSQEVIWLDEPTMWLLVMRSNQTVAKAFRRWLSREVIPQIRKTGAYATGERSGRLSTEERESICYEVMSLILAQKGKANKPKTVLPPIPPPANEWTDHEWLVVSMLKRKFQDGVRFMRNRDLQAASHPFQKITKMRHDGKMYEKLEKKGMIEIYRGRNGGLCFGLTHKILEVKR
jgi:prophage antirepressor-like protein